MLQARATHRVRRHEPHLIPNPKAGCTLIGYSCCYAVPKFDIRNIRFAAGILLLSLQSFGAQKPAIEDTRRYLISTLHAGAIYHVNNWYGIGLGLDVFYNSAVSKNTERNLYCHGYFEMDLDGDEIDEIVECATCGHEKGVDYTLAQKVRSGIAMNNEFKFGAVTAIVDWGLYFYNPSRHIYYDYHYDNYDKVVPKRPLLYTTPNGASGEEASHYIRFGLRYRIWDNLYLQTSAKTHLHICEFIEVGLGYQIPFYKTENRQEGRGNIFHYHKNWWKE